MAYSLNNKPLFLILALTGLVVFAVKTQSLMEFVAPTGPVGQERALKRVKISGVTASSEYESVRSEFAGRQIRDSKIRTSWGEGEVGPGAGSWVEVAFDEHEVSMVKMWAGNWDPQWDWMAQPRPAELDVIWADGTIETWRLANERAPQVFEPAKPKRTTSIRFRTKVVYPGLTTAVLAISEVQVFEDGHPDVVQMTAAKASSDRSDEDGSHVPIDVLDGLRDTYWCADDKEHGGVGEWLQIGFAESRKISAMRILNGVGTNGSAYRLGNSATAAKLQFSDGTTQDVQLRTSSVLQDVAITPVRTSWVRMVFTGIEKGSMYNDLCISEVEFH